MRIALNLLYLIPGVVGGTQTYAVELMQALARRDAENEYLYFVNREAADFPFVDAHNFRRVVCPLNATRRAVRYAWEQAVFPRLLRSQRVDVVHSLGYVGPLSTASRHVVTIHDLNYLCHENMIRPTQRKLLARMVPAVARAADHILAISEFSKNQIVEHIGVPAEKVTVTLLGARKMPSVSSEVQSETLTRYGVKTPYVVAFSSPSPHKNIGRLIEAFAQVKDTIPHSLVLIGHAPAAQDWQAESARAGLAGRTVTTGYVPDEDVILLLAQADLFVFPSLYEGFGLPALEAQQAGVAVASSNISSLPEIAGEGAVYFDPCSVAEITQTLRRCLADAELRRTLVGKGQRNLTRFDWNETARQTLEVYRRVVSR